MQRTGFLTLKRNPVEIYEAARVALFRVLVGIEWLFTFHSPPKCVNEKISSEAVCCRVTSCFTASYFLISSSYYPTIPPPHHPIILLSHHPTISPSNYLAVWLSHHPTNPPPHHPVVLLSRRSTNSPPHHPTVPPLCYYLPVGYTRSRHLGRCLRPSPEPLWYT